MLSTQLEAGQDRFSVLTVRRAIRHADDNCTDNPDLRAIPAGTRWVVNDTHTSGWISIHGDMRSTPTPCQNEVRSWVLALPVRSEYSGTDGKLPSQ